MTRFALDFARHAGGDLLWIAYVPDGLRRWFSQFADSCDPSLQPGSSLRIARLFSSPTLDDLELLLSRLRTDGLPRWEDASCPRETRSPELTHIAGAIDRGQLHLAGIIIDVHHLPTFIRRLRSGAAGPARGQPPKGAPPHGGLADDAQNVSSLLRQLVDANLHVLIATPIEPTLPSTGRTAARTDEAAILAIIDAAVDLAIIANAERSAAASDHQFRLDVCRSRYPALAPGSQLVGANWSDVLSAIQPGTDWLDRLARACPRLASSTSGEIREVSPRWVDATQEEFARWAEQRGWTVTHASSEQDRGEHWDLRIDQSGQSYRVDVKARSKIRRRDAESQDVWHWVELRGIVDVGWLFGGNADLIAIQTRDSFLLVRREDLASHVQHHVDPEDLVSDPRRAEYRVYHRRDDATRGRIRPTGADRGVLTLVPIDRLRQLAWEEWTAGSSDPPTFKPSARS